MTENYVDISRGGIRYLASGPTEGPLLIFIHGWPELAISYRHQLPIFGALGFRAVAVDMPGSGGSVVHKEQSDYSMEKINADLIEFLSALGRDKAVWIGHDWGSVMVWGIASHYPEHCHAVASLCVAYAWAERGIDHLISLVDRDFYPEATDPNGQWDYWRFYLERFDEACAFFDANVDKIFKGLFVRGDPAAADLPALTAGIFRAGGWFGGKPPEAEQIDPAVLDEIAHAAYVAAFKKTGFFGADSFYINTYTNVEYTDRSVNDGILEMPVLFLNAAYDYTCETQRFWRQGEAMRIRCKNLTAVNIKSGHWMQQEKPTEVNAAIAHWLATSAQIWAALPEPDWKPLPE
ncbi:hypothetical protein YP76_22095 [Sphingobium chungbukense]|uniref:AB hydrolase-1 domain-containing protein n=1 Tax=Sphingobium chungbukense TaxID=56193 RepID=A0A0M3AJR3_9SPHN|nr:hypothetical protein YP76_22095 [Sphingobium chungbukense]